MSLKLKNKAEIAAMPKIENNCHGCKWLDRDMFVNEDGNGYCCKVESSSQRRNPGCKMRRPNKVRCELYEAGDWATRYELTEEETDETD